MITPLEIENKKFSKQMMNGYSVEEVDDFLDELTACYEKLYKESNENQDKIASFIIWSACCFATFFISSAVD